MGLDMGQVFENSQNQNVITILLHVGVDSPILAGDQACSQHPNVNFVGALRGEILGATVHKSWSPTGRTAHGDLPDVTTQKWVSIILSCTSISMF